MIQKNDAPKEKDAHSCPPPQNKKNTQTHKHKNTKTQKHKNTKTQKHKNTKTQKHKNTKTQKHKNTKTNPKTQKPIPKHNNFTGSSTTTLA
jgi:hypothetical protein